VHGTHPSGGPGTDSADGKITVDAAARGSILNETEKKAKVFGYNADYI
jgi:hypothetical protein